MFFLVSIQLGSPASGDPLDGGMLYQLTWSFHSIGIPGEWGLLLKYTPAGLLAMSFHSIGIPGEWGLVNQPRFSPLASGFHSIGIPGEWGLDGRELLPGHENYWFPFNWDPRRVGTLNLALALGVLLLFPFNWDPRRVGTY